MMERWKLKNPKLFGILIIIIVIILSLLLLHITQQQDYSTVTFSVGTNEISFHCDIADDAPSRATGLLGRTDLGLDEGRVFLYDTAEIRTYHMVGMKFPLDIIFIDSQYTVLNVVEANISDEHIMSNGLAQFVVEINKGLCKQYGISQGITVAIKTN